MKRFIAVSIVTLMFCQSVFAADISVNLDGESVDFAIQSPVIVEGRTLIPLRGVFEKLGYEITWDGETKTASFVKDDTVVKVMVNSSEFTVNDETKTLDVPAQVINGSMMLPLRAIGEAAGLEVDWDGDTKTVDLKSKVVDARSDDFEFKFDSQSGKATVTPKTTVAEEITEETTEVKRTPVKLELTSEEKRVAENYVLYNKTMLFSISYMGVMNNYNTMLNEITKRSDDEQVIEELKEAIEINSAVLERVKTITNSKINNELLTAFRATVEKADKVYNAFLIAFQTGNGHKYDPKIYKAVNEYNASIGKLETATNNNVDSYMESISNLDEWNWSYDDLSDEEAKEVKAYQNQVGALLNENLKYESNLRKREKTDLSEKFANSIDAIENEIAYIAPPDKCKIDHQILLEGIKLAKEAAEINRRKESSDFIYMMALLTTFDACAKTCAGDYYSLGLFN